MATYIVAAEAAILGDALDSYDTLIKGKYDKKFEVYQRAMIKQIPLQIFQYSNLFYCYIYEHLFKDNRPPYL